MNVIHIKAGDSDTMTFAQQVAKQLSHFHCEGIFDLKSPPFSKWWTKTGEEADTQILTDCRPKT